jgi:hypothetical protein
VGLHQQIAHPFLGLPACLNLLHHMSCAWTRQLEQEAPLLHVRVRCHQDTAFPTFAQLYALLTVSTVSAYVVAFNAMLRLQVGTE